jgi:hypothetical protein
VLAPHRCIDNFPRRRLAAEDVVERGLFDRRCVRLDVLNGKACVHQIPARLNTIVTDQKDL